MDFIDTRLCVWTNSLIALLAMAWTASAAVGGENQVTSQSVQSEHASEQPSRGTPLSPSILLFHKPHYTHGVAYVRRAAELGCRQVNIVVALHCQINAHHEVVSYGVLQEGRYILLNDALRMRFQESLRQVFAEAVSQDMELTVLAHLNSWGEINEWRNLFRFDPLVRYGKYNYQEAMIQPIFDALTEAIPKSQVVDFTLVGEMGNSLFAHAASYRKIVDQLSGRKNPLPLRLGLGMNFDNVTGDHRPSKGERRQVQQLIDQCDFIGLSDYRWFDPPPAPADFENAIAIFLQEMEKHGAKLPRAMPLHLTEVGIGGGTENGLAKTPAEAAATPWEGSDDPKRNPWRSTEMQKFRAEFHQALLQFLAHQPAANPVTKAFLWSEGSWDPMGIIDRSFADEQIIQMIQRHNRIVVAR